MKLPHRTLAARTLHGLTALTFLALLSAAPGAGAIAASPPDLDWLAGHWSGEKEGTQSEEHWTTGAGGTLVGMHKDVRAGRAISFEFLRIEVGADGKPCYLASPGGAAPTRFCAIEIAPRRIVFENLEHDFPQRILYWLDAEGALHARIEGPMRGQAVSDEWVWKKPAR